ncbi:MAG TPA: hypothetical protein VFV38_47680 [Ktedonobacteraceae bacterium]|nr:hypothetical protein [Ktedonobacteraceae bacterium]
MHTSSSHPVSSPSTGPQIPLNAGHPCAALLPVLEEDASAPDAAWLLTLARKVLDAIEDILPVNILPLQTSGFLTTPLPVWRVQPLLIVPWGSTQEPFPHASGIQLFQYLGLERLLQTFPLVTLARPRPALSEVISLNGLGGWDVGSHIGLAQLVTLCPGWDEEVCLCGPVCVLRSPQPALPPVLPSHAQSQASLRLLRAAYSGQTLDTQATLDVQWTERYLSHILTALIRTVIAAQPSVMNVNTAEETNATFWQERKR